MAEQSTAALRDAGSIPAGKKYSYGLQIVFPGLTVCVYDFKCKRTHDTGVIPVITKKNTMLQSASSLIRHQSYQGIRLVTGKPRGDPRLTTLGGSP